MHLRYQMNKILQDGRRVCAINTRPKFFDISFVTIGAEKASHVLKKVAHEGRVHEVVSSAEAGERYYGKVASVLKHGQHRKAADIEKDVPSTPTANITSVLKEKALRYMDGAGDIKATEKPIDKSVLDQVSQFPLKEALGTLASLGIGLKPEEFQKIVLVKQGHADLAAKLEKRGWVFDESDPGKVPSWMPKVSAWDANEKIAHILGSHLHDRSCYSEPLLVRIEQATKTASLIPSSQWFTRTEGEDQDASGRNPLVPLSIALSGAFYGFNKAFPEMVGRGPAFIRVLGRHPWLLPILSAIGVGAMTERAVRVGDLPISKHGSLRGLDGKNSRVYDGVKMAGLGLVSRAGLIPASYIYSGIQQSKWSEGKKLGALNRLIAEYPAESALTAFGLPDITRAVKRGLFKKAGFGADFALHLVGARSKFMPQTLLGAGVDAAILSGIGKYLSSKQKKGIGNANAR